MRWMSPKIMGSHSSFLSSFFSNLSSRFKVVSRLASMGSFKVYIRFLGRLVEVSNFT